MEEALDGVRAGIRETFNCPLSTAVDMMVWNITKEKITERMAVSPDSASAGPGPTRQTPPEKGRPDPVWGSRRHPRDLRRSPSRQ